jgi:diguanylate cyclase (GGDEF)-like protein/PAS domain S-box-containing protein
MIGIYAYELQIRCKIAYRNHITHKSWCKWFKGGPLVIVNSTNTLVQKSNAVQNHQHSQKGFESDFYSLIFEHHPDAIFTLDKEGNFLSINYKVEEFIGYEPMELTGTFNHLIKEEDLDDVLKHFHLALKGEPQTYNCKVIHKNGYLVHLNITNIPLKINGEIVGLYGLAKNLTKLDQKEAELIKITNSLNLAQEVAKIGSWDYDTESNFVYCSEPLFSILGMKNETGKVPTYENLLEMILPEDRDKFDQQFQRTKQHGTEMNMEYRIQRQDHSFITAQVRAIAKKDSNGKVARIIGILYDVSDRIITENRLKESENRFNNIAENIDVGLWSMDVLTKQVVYVSPAVEKFTGYTRQDFLSGQKCWVDLIHQDDVKNYSKLQSKLLDGEMLHQQYRLIHANGDLLWMEDKTFPILNAEGQLIRLDGLIQDISERKRNEEQINFFAYHDYLTELPNRRMFDQKLEQWIAQDQGRNDKFALFYLDLDRFKFVNDTLGHEIGDALLSEISKRLLSIAGNNNVFRVGGDEFTIIQPNLLAKDPVALGKELVREIRKPFQIEGYEIHMTTSIGVSIFPDDGETLKELKMNSDAALYRAKELGKNNVQLFTKSLNSESYKLFTLENDLRKAIQRDEFVLHYQPRVDTLTGEMVGAEALIRWIHSKWGLVSPCDFIPLAEETGYIHEISEWVFHQVCQQLNEWKGKGCHLVPISINLSAKTLLKADLVQIIKENLSTYSISPNLIEIEITEDSLIKNEGLGLSTIQLLRDMGIKIAIDDFGTGYSSIGYLKKFKVDYIKIDRTFINEIHENSEDSILVQSIILLAKGFSLKIVAEGVETEEQWKHLKLLNCHFIQGYLFSKPLPAEQFTYSFLLDKKNILPFKGNSHNLKKVCRRFIEASRNKKEHRL